MVQNGPNLSKNGLDPGEAPKWSKTDQLCPKMALAPERPQNRTSFLDLLLASYFSFLFRPTACCFPQTLFQFSMSLTCHSRRVASLAWREHRPTLHYMSEALLQKYVFRCYTVAFFLCLLHPTSDFFFFQPHVAFRKHSSSFPSLRLAIPGGWQVLLGGSNARHPIA